MVQLTRLDGNALWINVSSIALVEETPTTVIRTREGEVVRVKERASQIADLMAEARASVILRGIERALERDQSLNSWQCTFAPTTTDAEDAVQRAVQRFEE